MNAWPDSGAIMRSSVALRLEVVMSESEQTNQLLTEIRDLLATRSQQHIERKGRTLTLQWVSLFIVVYAAVYFALRTVN